jgi:hypothetical protein
MYGSIFLLPLNILIHMYTIRPRDYISGELPPGRRISTADIILLQILKNLRQRR